MNIQDSIEICVVVLVFVVQYLCYMEYVQAYKDCIYLLTYSMVQSPFWEANWFAASPEIPRISRNPKVHYYAHKRPPPVCILGQSIYPHPTSWRSILILSTHLCLGLPSGLFPSGFPTKTLYTPLSSPIRATCPAHHILLDFITRTILGEECESFNSSLCNLLHSPVTSSLLGPNILLRVQCNSILRKQNNPEDLAKFKTKDCHRNQCKAEGMCSQSA